MSRSAALPAESIVPDPVKPMMASSGWVPWSRFIKFRPSDSHNFISAMRMSTFDVSIIVMALCAVATAVTFIPLYAAAIEHDLRMCCSLANTSKFIAFVLR